MTLEVRLAKGVAERTAACEIVRLAFQSKAPLLSLAAQRQASVRRLSAEWWVLGDGGEPLATLLCYPLSFGLPDGSVRPGFGFGAVATHPEHRRRGHAARLCTEVTEDCARRGRDLGLLFSAIAPAYYERLGWRSCPAWDPVTTRLKELAEGGPAAALVPIDPRRSIAELTRLYQESHRGQLHLHRDDEAYSRSIAREPDDWWVGVGEPDGRLSAAARLGRDGVALDLIELTGPEEMVPSLLRALAALALDLGCEKLGSWLPHRGFVASCCEDVGREKSLPMVLGTNADVSSQFWGSDYF